MAHLSTIKSEFNKKFKGVDVKEIKKHSFGLFTVKVKKEMPKSTKHGFLMGESDWDLNKENGIVFDKKINWI